MFNAVPAFVESSARYERTEKMKFQLAGFESWTFQLVFCGSLLVLEAERDGVLLSTILQPMDCTRTRIHELIRQPSCTLANH